MTDCFLMHSSFDQWSDMLCRNEPVCKHMNHVPSDFIGISPKNDTCVRSGSAICLINIIVFVNVYLISIKVQTF